MERPEEDCCAVCFSPCASPAQPCCSGSSVCAPCLALVCSQAPAGNGVGRCPLCRRFLRRAGDGAFVSCDNQARCRVCFQDRDLPGGAVVCPPCAHGLRSPLQYECERCRGLQLIPHPMFTHQPSPSEFSTVTWACHGACGDFTRWRATPASLRLISPADAPPSWPPGWAEAAAMEALRAHARAQARAAEGGGGGGGGDRDGDGEGPRGTRLATFLFVTLLSLGVLAFIVTGVA